MRTLLPPQYCGKSGGGQNNCCDDPCSSLTNITWSNHGNKHVPQKKLNWKQIIDSTKHAGVTRYKPGVNIQAVEKTVWINGTNKCKFREELNMESVSGIRYNRGQQW